ncbi:hypothetical protein GDO78_018734 [Eleutherodactylus coqui]|uniref:Uncharacterized protein n=1 Tax=Eleutherodactylus coqui TaxID=57060 RepID=A0A8J6JUP8_ELECQ|nr:hypothetical protein GDO78_018734 [Eleutherodactylus coqui]
MNFLSLADLGTISILIGKSPLRFAAEWDWADRCPEDVTFTAVYEKIGVPDSEPQDCAATAECSCEIPSDLLDPSSNYTLLVSATTTDGRKLSSSRDFDPNRGE